MSNAIAESVKRVKTQRALLQVVVGGLCGIVATGPMTALMTLLHRRLPASQRYPLPPRLITMNIARRAGIAGDMDEDTRSTATILAHFGYGAFAGGIYGLLAGRTRLGPPARGLVFGLLVWTVSYLGLLPGTGALAPATRQPLRRNLLMIVAHLLWGLALSGLEQLLQPRPSLMQTGARKG